MRVIRCDRVVQQRPRRRGPQRDGTHG
jgi:hypothetical protein